MIGERPSRITKRSVSEMLRRVIPGFAYHALAATPQECAMLVRESAPLLARVGAYQGSHYDAVVRDYKEIEAGAVKWSPAARSVLARLMVLSGMAPVAEWGPCAIPAGLPPASRAVHVIDLKESTGVIKPHVDSVEHGGSIVAVLSLLSPRKLALSLPTKEYKQVDAPARSYERARFDDDDDIRAFKDGDRVYEQVVDPGSLYILRDYARYELSHEIESGPEKRLSIVFRDEPPTPAWMKDD